MDSIKPLKREELLRLVDQVHTAVERDTSDWDRYTGTMPGSSGHFRWGGSRRDVSGWTIELWVIPVPEGEERSFVEAGRSPTPNGG